MTKPESESLGRLQAARTLQGIEELCGASNELEELHASAAVELGRRSGELDAVQDAGRQLALRSREVKTGLQLLREALERAKLTALNVGLEGARLGDPAGKALVVMGDEVRGLLARAADALDEHMALLVEMDSDRERFFTDLAAANAGVRSAQRGLELSRTRQTEATAALGALRDDLLSALGSDLETARTLSRAASLAHNLRDCLLELGGRSPHGGDAVRELLSPLLSLVPAERSSSGP